MNIKVLVVLIVAAVLLNSYPAVAANDPGNEVKYCPAVCVPLYELQNGCELNNCGSGCGADNINTFTSETDCKNRIGGAESGIVTPNKNIVCVDRNIFYVGIGVLILLLVIVIFLVKRKKV